MDNRQLKLLAKQLNQQALLLENNNDHSTFLSLIATGNVLVEAAKKALADEQLSVPESEQLYSLYYKHSLLSEEALNDAIQGMNGEIEKPEYVRMKEKNEIAREQLKRLEEEIKEESKAAETLRIAVEKAEADKDEAQTELEALRVREYAIRELMKDCSSEKLEEQRTLNTELRTQFEVALGKQKELTASNETLKRDIDQIEKDIAEIPDENRKLLEDFKEKSVLLEELIKADVKYGQEVQDELDRKIEELQPVVEENHHAVMRLRSRFEELDDQNHQLLTEQNEISVEIINRISAYLAQIEPDITDEENRLKTIQKTADYFTERLELCLENRRKYASWLDGDTNPLQAMIAKLDQVEAEQLRKTLDINSISSINKLSRDTRQNLEELDRILDKCIKAVNLDMKNIELKARR